VLPSPFPNIADQISLMLPMSRCHNEVVPIDVLDYGRTPTGFTQEQNQGLQIFKTFGLADRYGEIRVEERRNVVVDQLKDHEGIYSTY
jgi:hypothetical protein